MCFPIARLKLKIPIVPQIKMPNPNMPVRIQLSPQLRITLHKQLKAIINAPYFARHFSKFDEFSFLKIISPNSFHI